MGRVEHVRQRQPAAVQAATPAVLAPLDAVHTTLGAVGNTTALAALLDGDDLDGWGALVTDATTLSLAGITPHAGPAQGSNQATVAVMRLARAEGVNHAALASLRLGGGRPLPPAILARVNAVFGADFSHVRLHQDAAAARMAEAAQARAFTVGHEIWFNAGELDLGTPEGVDLLLHELTHVMQADEGRLSSGPGLSVSSPSDPHEQEAERVAASLAPAWESASWADDAGLVGDGLLDDAAWASAVDAGPVAAEGVVSRAGGEDEATPAPMVNGVKVGVWADSTEAALIGGDELKPPHGVEGGFASRGEAVAWAGPQLAEGGADGGLIVRQGERWFAFTMTVESLLYDFTAENVTGGLFEDSLHADLVAAPGLEGFITQDGVFVVPHTSVEIAEDGEPLSGVFAPSDGHLVAPKESDYGSIVADAQAGTLPPMDEAGAVALFKGVLKAKALDGLAQNRAELEKRRAEHAPDAPGAEERWERLRPLIEGDRLLAEAEDQLDTQLMGAWMGMGPSSPMVESVPDPAVIEEIHALNAQRDAVRAARDELHKNAPELLTLGPDVKPDDAVNTLHDGMSARIDEALVALEEVRQKVLTEDMPLTKLGPVVQATAATLGLERPEDPLGVHVLPWLKSQDLEEALWSWGGTVLTIGLTIGAAFATGGWALVLGGAGAAVGFTTAAVEFEVADDLNDAATACEGGVSDCLIDDPDAARLHYALAALNLALAALDLGLVGRGALMMRAQRIRSLVNQRAAKAAGIVLKYTDDELLQIWVKGQAAGLTEQEIIDLVFIGSRDAKRRSASALMEQMDHVIMFRQRGYPAHFHSQEEFQQFGAALKAEVSKLKVPVDDLRVQGSAARTPGADDLDLAVMIPEDNFLDIVRKAFDNKIKVMDPDTKAVQTLDLKKMSVDDLNELVELFGTSKERFLNKHVFEDFKYVYTNRIINAKGLKKQFLGTFDAETVLIEMQRKFPHLNFTNIAFQTPGSKFDLHPFFPIP